MQYLDCLGLKPSLNISGNGRHVTVVGVILSILCTCFIFAFGLYFFIRLFKREVFSVSQSDGILDFPSIDNAFTPIIFSLVDGSGQYIPNGSLYFNFQGFVAAAPGTEHNVGYSLWYDVVPCNLSTSFGQYKHLFEKIPNLEQYSCIGNFELMNKTAFGSYGNVQTGYSTMDLLINLCSNATNNNSCGPLTNQQQILKSAFLRFGYLDNTIDHNDIYNPIKLKFKTEFLPFSGTLFTRNYYWMRTVDYTTDYGFVFSDIQSQHFGQMDSKSQYVDLSVNLGGDTIVALTGVKFGHISILSNQIWHRYNRSYSKMQEVMASIGGVSSALMFWGYLMVNVIGRRIYMIKLANIFFRFKESKSQKFKDLLIELKNTEMPNKEVKLEHKTNSEMEEINTGKLTEK